VAASVAAADHDHIRLNTLIRAGPIPDPQAFGAVNDGFFHVQVLQMRLFVGDNDIDVIPTAQTMVGHRQQGVDIWRQIDARDFGVFVDHYIQKPRILVGEPVVVLAPDCRGNK
jgi:hypothetical protein